MQHGVMAASVALGLEVLDELMTAEVAELAGARGKHDVERTHLRHGTEREATAQRSSSTSRSSVSRRFVAATGARLHALTSPRIHDERWLTLLIQGPGFPVTTLAGTRGLVAAAPQRPPRSAPVGAEPASDEDPLNPAV